MTLRRVASIFVQKKLILMYAYTRQTQRLAEPHNKMAPFLLDYFNSVAGQEQETETKKRFDHDVRSSVQGRLCLNERLRQQCDGPFDNLTARCEPTCENHWNFDRFVSRQTRNLCMCVGRRVAGSFLLWSHFQSIWYV